MITWCDQKQPVGEINLKLTRCSRCATHFRPWPFLQCSVSLRSKRFQSSNCAKVGATAKKNGNLLKSQLSRRTRAETLTTQAIFKSVRLRGVFVFFVFKFLSSVLVCSTESLLNSKSLDILFGWSSAEAAEILQGVLQLRNSTQSPVPFHSKRHLKL